MPNSHVIPRVGAAGKIHGESSARYSRGVRVREYAHTARKSRTLSRALKTKDSPTTSIAESLRGKSEFREALKRKVAIIIATAAALPLNCAFNCSATVYVYMRLPTALLLPRGNLRSTAIAIAIRILCTLHGCKGRMRKRERERGVVLADVISQPILDACTFSTIYGMRINAYARSINTGIVERYLGKRLISARAAAIYVVMRSHRETK